MISTLVCSGLLILFVMAACVTAEYLKKELRKAGGVK